MRYTVLWIPDVEREFTNLWLQAPDRNEVTDAANRIDRLLNRRPLDVGESRDQNQRILIVPPLAATYRVYPADWLVQVTAIWRFTRP